MRRVTMACLALLVFATASSALSAQQSIYMLVDDIRGDQVAPHDREFKLNSFSSASANNTTFGGATSGLSAGKPTFSPVKVSMRLHPGSTGAFHRALAAGTRLPSIEIRHYNSSNQLLYKTAFENVYLTGVTTEASDEAQQEIAFVYARVKWFASPDPARPAPVQVACWDVALIRAC